MSARDNQAVDLILELDVPDAHRDHRHGCRQADRRPHGASEDAGPAGLPLQVTTASLVVMLGVVLTGQALAQVV
jgi:hypothetical protein